MSSLVAAIPSFLRATKLLMRRWDVRPAASQKAGEPEKVGYAGRATPTVAETVSGPVTGSVTEQPTRVESWWWRPR